MLLLIRWHSTIRIPAVIEAFEQAPIYAPRVAKVTQLHVETGDFVKKGEVLMTLESDELNNEIIAAQRRIDLALALISRIAADASDRDQKIVLDTELKQWQAELAVFNEEKDLLNIKADFDGVVVDLDTDLHAGRWEGENSMLGTLVSQSGNKIRGYITASDLGRIDKGTPSLFVPDLLEQERASGTISFVDTANADALTIPELTPHYDGAIAVSLVEQELEPLKAWYHISVDVDKESPTVSRAVRGTLLAEEGAKVWHSGSGAGQST